MGVLPASYVRATQPLSVNVGRSYGRGKFNDSQPPLRAA